MCIAVHSFSFTCFQYSTIIYCRSPGNFHSAKNKQKYFHPFIKFLAMTFNFIYKYNHCFKFNCSFCLFFSFPFSLRKKKYFILCRYKSIDIGIFVSLSLNKVLYALGYLYFCRALVVLKEMAEMPTVSIIDTHLLSKMKCR